jgi:hypothetical protein
VSAERGIRLSKKLGLVAVGGSTTLVCGDAIAVVVGALGSATNTLGGDPATLFPGGKGRVKVGGGPASAGGVKATELT